MSKKFFPTILDIALVTAGGLLAVPPTTQLAHDWKDLAKATEASGDSIEERAMDYADKTIFRGDPAFSEAQADIMTTKSVPIATGFAMIVAAARRRRQSSPPQK